MTAHRITMPSRFPSSILLAIAFSKDAFPNRRHIFARRNKSLSVPKSAQSSCATASQNRRLRKSSSAISGFRSLYGREQHSTAIALNSTCFWNLSPGGLSLRELWPLPHRLTGPATQDRCCGRNVVGPGEYSKGFFCVRNGLYRANLWPATARGMPARSAFGAVAGVNPALVIKVSIGPLWPSPASTTRWPPGARRRAAWGISAR